MSELVLTLLRLSFLALLWLTILWCLRTLRGDIYGTRVGARAGGRRRVGRSGAAPRDSRDQRDDGASAGGGGAPRSAPVTLVVRAGPLAGTTLNLRSSAVLIGRAPSCTLVLDDDYTSGRHARIFPHDGRWFVEDLGSTNGTWLGEHRVGDPEPLEIGRQLKVGQTLVELRR
ncbi:FHA domain-containing protein FhaB/FipA [Litorihabitans aurantiacus]|uniref:Phosphopeptide-binding protein n=1 Tax=Litorihabitans aurantiacus TaxID=1930061 RepID=A0AA38CRU2_9MICO|nr:FHA domain-containing protein [Litorihabitans aurantiacus]GMA33113.1 phosphopeptide-binding protein [Litorihabitans aurantiacus]